MQSPLPGDEAARSRVLWNYRILDTPPEERFDDLVRVATYICGTPIELSGVPPNGSLANTRPTIRPLQTP